MEPGSEAGLSTFHLKPVFPAKNQMERSAPLENFRKKWNISVPRCYLNFPVSSGMTGNFCSICFNQTVRSQSKVNNQTEERSNLPVESIQINPKFRSTVDRGHFFSSLSCSPFFFFDPGSCGVITIEFSKGSTSFRSVYEMEKLHCSDLPKNSRRKVHVNEKHSSSLTEIKLGQKEIHDSKPLMGQQYPLFRRFVNKKVFSLFRCRCLGSSSNAWG